VLWRSIKLMYRMWYTTLSSITGYTVLWQIQADKCSGTVLTIWERWQPAEIATGLQTREEISIGLPNHAVHVTTLSMPNRKGFLIGLQRWLERRTKMDRWRFASSGGSIRERWWRNTTLSQLQQTSILYRSKERVHGTRQVRS